MEARRILIYGVTGAGKTTFAKRLGERTGIPFHHVDDLTFEPGWKQVSDEGQREAIGRIVEGDEWILDTAYGKWIDLPLSRVQLVLGLDYPRWLSLWRLLARTVHRAVTGEPVCNNNRESLRLALSRESIILWHFRSFSRKRARMRAWAAAGEPPTILFKHPREAAEWLESLGREAAVPGQR
jgi:adenylate kinase family enzyme